MYPGILKPKENRRRTHNAESLNGGVPMYIRRRNKNQDQHPSYTRAALTLPEFRCASVRFHRTLIKSMKRIEGEGMERKKERGQETRGTKNRKRAEQIDHRKMGGVYRMRIRKEKGFAHTHTHSCHASIPRRSDCEDLESSGAELVRAASLMKGVRE